MAPIVFLLSFIYLAGVHYFIYEFGLVKKSRRMYLYLARFFVLLAVVPLSILCVLFYSYVWNPSTYSDLFIPVLIILAAYGFLVLVVSFGYKKALGDNEKSYPVKKKLIIVTVTTLLLLLMSIASSVRALYLLHFDSAVPDNYELVGDYKIPQNIYQEFERTMNGDEPYLSLNLEYCTGYGEALVVSKGYSFSSVTHYYSLSGKLAHVRKTSDTDFFSLGIGDALITMDCEILKTHKKNWEVPIIE